MRLVPYIKQEFLHGLSSLLFYRRMNKFFKCPHFLLITHFPLVFKCGQFSCYHCFPESFKLNQICNYCRMPVQIKEVLTLNDDQLSRPNSLVDQMYEDLDIQCTNIGCKLQFGIDKINKHEFFDCQYRIIKCPAKDCYYNNNPLHVHKHALLCPFLKFYCGTCYGAYGAEILEHSCAIMIKRRLLEYARISISGLPELKNHNNGDVFLPPHVTYEPFDISELSEVRAKINSSSPLCNGVGLTGFEQRTRVLQRQHGIPRANDPENNISQINFS